jgi:tetratricopeptide (TPR) repeat protein
LYLAKLRIIEKTNLQKNLNEVLVKLDELQRRFSELSKLEPKKLTLQLLIADVQRRKAVIYISQHNYTEGNTYLTSALDKLRQLHAAAKTDAAIRESLIDSLLLKAALEKQENIADATQHCESVRSLLKPLVVNSKDFRILAPWVKAHVCLNKMEQSTPARRLLEKMFYRDPTYLQYFTPQPLKKVNL